MPRGFAQLRLFFPSTRTPDESEDAVRKDRHARELDRIGREQKKWGMIIARASEMMHAANPPTWASTP